MRATIICLLAIAFIVGVCGRALDEGTECQSGTVTKIECNTCRCFNGNYACTRKICPNAIHGEGNGLRLKRDSSCIPGTTFKQDCNTCHCGNNGVAGCTYKLCLPKNN